TAEHVTNSLWRRLPMGDPEKTQDLAEYFEKQAEPEPEIEPEEVKPEKPPEPVAGSDPRIPLCPKCGKDFYPIIRPYRVPMMIERGAHLVYFAFIACEKCRQLIETQIVAVHAPNVQIAEPRIVA